MILSMLLAASLQNATDPVAVPAPPSAAAPKVCRRTQSSGSRMTAKRVCKTAEEWAREDALGGGASGITGLSGKRN